MPETEPKRRRIAFDVLANPSAIGGVFLDSGAFSLRGMYAKKHDPANPHSWYETDAYWTYVDSYVRFVKKFGHALEFYANVDVIYNAELSWKTLKYLEKQGLKPVPVIHFGTSMKWVMKHFDAGYDYIGLGGFASSHMGGREAYLGWVGQIYEAACTGASRLPRIKFHGFAMTSWHLLTMFPWYSVDSASWVKAASFGGIYVPRKTGGDFNFQRAPYALQISAKSSTRNARFKHYMTLNKEERKTVEEWLELIGVELGDEKDDENRGVLNHYKPRVKANLLYFQAMAEHLPPWPWPYRGVVLRQGFFEHQRINSPT